MWTALAPIYCQAIRSGALPLHAGMLERDGAAVLLVGPGGIGKSTCCRRAPAPWKSPCDDEVLILANREGGFLVHPMPTWSDHLYTGSKNTWDVQSYFHLSAIFFLVSAPEDLVYSVGQGQATILLMEFAKQVTKKNFSNMSWPEQKGIKPRLFETACKIARTIPAFTLHCSLTGRFWEEIERVL